MSDTDPGGRGKALRELPRDLSKGLEAALIRDGRITVYAIGPIRIMSMFAIEKEAGRPGQRGVRVVRAQPHVRRVDSLLQAEIARRRSGQRELNPIRQAPSLIKIAGHRTQVPGAQPRRELHGSEVVRLLERLLHRTGILEHPAARV